MTDIVLSPSLEFDLRSRATSGTTRHYACREEFIILDDGGKPARSEVRTANLEREVLEQRPSGAPVVRWTLEAFTLAVDGVSAADSDWRPATGASSFECCPEEAESCMPPVESLGLETTSISAWVTAELVIHEWAFEMIATTAHGGIDRLRRLGDTTVMPLSGANDRVAYGSMIDVTLVRGESTLRFDGLTVRNGLNAALLGCHMQYDLAAAGLGPAHVELIAQLWLDLETGELVAGEARQANYISSVPRPDGTAGPMNHVIETSLGPVAG